MSKPYVREIIGDDLLGQQGISFFNYKIINNRKR